MTELLCLALVARYFVRGGTFGRTAINLTNTRRQTFSHLHRRDLFVCEYISYTCIDHRLPATHVLNKVRHSHLRFRPVDIVTNNAIEESKTTAQ